MAFLSGTAPGTADDELPGGQDVEYSWYYIAIAFVVSWRQRKRTTYTHRVFYAIDDTGGETFDATWTVGASTYNLRSVDYEMSYLDKRGIAVATYELVGSWVAV